MFGVDDAISGLVGGGMKMLANWQQNQYATEAAEQQQQWGEASQKKAMAFNQEEANRSREFNAQQADIARSFSAGQQLQAEGYNANQAEINRQFQDRMSSSAYQRSMRDMRNSGLNPILAYQQGGAHTPSGGMGSIGAVGGQAASGTPANVGAIPGAATGPRTGLLSGALTSAIEAMRLSPEIKNLKAEEDVKHSQSANLDAGSLLHKANAAHSLEAANTERAKQMQIKNEIEQKGGEVGGLSFHANPSYWWKKWQALGDSEPQRDHGKGLGNPKADVSSSAQGYKRHGTGDDTYYSR